ncbi:MAG: hypothetical protein ACK4YM_05690 [Novosphingobium sp.]
MTSWVARDHFGLTVSGGSVHQVSAAPPLFDPVTLFGAIKHVPDPAADIAPLCGSW